MFQASLAGPSPPRYLIIPNSIEFFLRLIAFLYQPGRVIGRTYQKYFHDQDRSESPKQDPPNGPALRETRPDSRSQSNN